MLLLPAAMHVRVKRGTTTWFVSVEASQTVQTLLEALSVLVSKPADQLQLVPLDATTCTQASGPVLRVDEMLAARHIGDSAPLGLCFYAEEGGFEPLYVAPTPPLSGGPETA